MNSLQEAADGEEQFHCGCQNCVVTATADPFVAWASAWEEGGPQHHQSFFIHQDMESGNMPQGISDGPVAISLGRGEEKSNTPSEP